MRDPAREPPRQLLLLDLAALRLRGLLPQEAQVLLRRHGDAREEKKREDDDPDRERDERRIGRPQSGEDQEGADADDGRDGQRVERPKPLREQRAVPLGLRVEEEGDGGAEVGEVVDEEEAVAQPEVVRLAPERVLERDEVRGLDDDRRRQPQDRPADRAPRPAHEDQVQDDEVRRRHDVVEDQPEMNGLRRRVNPRQRPDRDDRERDSEHRRRHVRRDSPRRARRERRERDPDQRREPERPDRERRHEVETRDGREREPERVDEAKGVARRCQEDRDPEEKQRLAEPPKEIGPARRGEEDETRNRRHDERRRRPGQAPRERTKGRQPRDRRQEGKHPGGRGQPEAGRSRTARVGNRRSLLGPSVRRIGSQCGCAMISPHGSSSRQRRAGRHRGRRLRRRRPRRGRKGLRYLRAWRRRPGRRRDARRDGPARHARRHRRAHAPRHAVRRDDLGRRLRVGHDRRGARRHDVDRGLRDPVQGPDAARGAGKPG